MKWYIVPLLAIAAFVLTYGLADALLGDSQDAQGQVNAAGAPPAFTLLFSKSNDRSNPEGLDGKTVDGDIFVFTSPDDGVDDVDFFLDDSFRRRERFPGFDFNGGSALIANKWGTPEVDDGEHTIKAELLLLDGSTVEVSATFTVLNDEPPPPPEPPQQREDQITITAAPVAFVAGEFWQSPATSVFVIVALDPADYPAGTEYRYESVLAIESADMTGCTRLYNLTTDLPVAGSEICLTVTTPPLTERLRSGPIALSSGENEYTIQSICLQPACGASWHATRIIAEWTE